MSGKLVLHVDGSRVLPPSREFQSFGWGLVAIHDDTHHEKFGNVRGKKQSILNGHHEHIAFVEGVRYAVEKGFAFKDVTIACDDDIFGYSAFCLHEGNFGQVGAEKIKNRLKRVVDLCYSPPVYDQVMAAFLECRVIKLKGHRNDVYQERADYLAKFAAYVPVEPHRAPLIPYEDWLGQGFVCYSKGEVEPVRSIWYPPFVPSPVTAVT